jgi:hypothetical protein
MTHDAVQAQAARALGFVVVIPGRGANPQDRGSSGAYRLGLAFDQAAIKKYQVGT